MASYCVDSNYAAFSVTSFSFSFSSFVWIKDVKISKKDFSGWRPAIAFLYLFLFHSLLRLTSFLSQNKNKDVEIEEKDIGIKSAELTSEIEIEKIEHDEYHD